MELNILLIMVSVLSTAIAFVPLSLLNNESTYQRRSKVHEAIHNWAVAHDYDMRALDMYDSIETYEATFWRFWDQGVENILPKEYYDMLKEEGFL